MLSRNLRHCEFKILEDQLVAHIRAEGQQGNGNFRDHAGLFILDKGVVATDINDGTAHKNAPFRKPPLETGAVIVWEG